MRTLRIFISSPGDVSAERQIAGKVLERLQGKYWSFVRLDDVFWEQKVVRSTAHYQDELVNPGDCEIVVGVLWSRLGSPLPEKFRKQSGERYESGTEWELEVAFEAYERRLAESGDSVAAKPDIIVYHRKTPVTPSDEPVEQSEAANQERKLSNYLKSRYFFPDGTIKRPLIGYGTLDEFEAKFSNDLDELILRTIPGLKAGYEPPPISGSPFKGLHFFDFADNDRYFGRNREIRRIQDLLRLRATAGLPFVLIYGGSGYGKSSLMRAGLAPVITRPGGAMEGIDAWRRVLMQPALGQGPLCERLVRAIAMRPTPEEAEQSRLNRHWPLPGAAEWITDDRDLASLARRFEQEDTLGAAVDELAQTLESLQRHLLLQIDQLEEVFTTPGVLPEGRESFFRALRALAESGRVWVVATMRSEFFPRVAEEPGLLFLLGSDGHFILPPPDRQSLHEIIRYPALAARLDFQRRMEPLAIAGEAARFEDLGDQILSDAETSPDSLPLLEFTLQQLYEKRHSGLLEWEAYAALGGLKGAIAERAGSVFDSLEAEAREARHRIFASLVRIDSSHGTVARQRAPLATLTSSPGARAFLTAFLDAHLLVTDEESGTATVTLVHESLLTHWAELSGWIANHRGDLLAKQRLREQTNLWLSNHRSRTYLLTEGRLAEAERVAADPIFALAPEESDYLRNSRANARRKLRFFQAAALVFGLLAVGAGVLGWMSQIRKREAEANAREAQTQRGLAELKAEAERVALRKSEEELYFASIGAANEALQRGSSLDMLRALATAPADHREWEWNFLARAARFAPLKIKSDEIGILDEGRFKGSGLHAAAVAMLEDSSEAKFPKTLRASSFTVSAVSHGRSGSRLVFSRNSDDAVLQELSTTTYSSIGAIWLSADESCVLMHNAPMRTESLELDQALGGSDVSGTSDVSGAFSEFCLIPVPNDLGLVAMKAVRSGFKEAVEDSGDEEAITIADVEFKTAGRSTVAAGVAGCEVTTATLRPGKSPMFDSQLVPTGFGFSEPELAILTLPPSQRKAAWHWSRAQPADAPAVAEDEYQKPLPVRLPVAVDWNDPTLPILAIRMDGQVEIAPAGDPSKATTFPLADKTALEIWKSSATVDGSYDTGACFSKDGTRLLLCPYRGDQAAILDRKTLKPVTMISNASYGEWKWSMIATDRTARPGSAVWRLSPKGTYSSLNAYNAPSAVYDMGIARNTDGQMVWNRTDTRVLGVDWDGSESLFAVHDFQMESIRVSEGIDGRVRTSVRYTGRQGEKLIQDSPRATSRLIVGTSLLRREDMRPVMQCPQSMRIAPDWSWVAYLQTADITYEEGRPNTLPVRVITGLVPEPGSQGMLADRIREFELELLDPAAKARERSPSVATDSPERRATALIRRIAWPRDGILDLHSAEVGALEKRLAAGSKELSELASRLPNQTDLQFLTTASRSLDGSIPEGEIRSKLKEGLDANNTLRLSRWTALAMMLDLKTNKRWLLDHGLDLFDEWTLLRSLPDKPEPVSERVRRSNLIENNCPNRLWLLHGAALASEGRKEDALACAIRVTLVAPDLMESLSKEVAEGDLPIWLAATPPWLQSSFRTLLAEMPERAVWLSDLQDYIPRALALHPQLLHGDFLQSVRNDAELPTPARCLAWIEWNRRAGDALDAHAVAEQRDEFFKTEAATREDAILSSRIWLDEERPEEDRQQAIRRTLDWKKAHPRFGDTDDELIALIVARAGDGDEPGALADLATLIQRRPAFRHDPALFGAALCVNERPVLSRLLSTWYAKSVDAQPAGERFIWKFHSLRLAGLRPEALQFARITESGGKASPADRIAFIKLAFADKDWADYRPMISVCTTDPGDDSELLFCAALFQALDGRAAEGWKLLTRAAKLDPAYQRKQSAQEWTGQLRTRDWDNQSALGQAVVALFRAMPPTEAGTLEELEAIAADAASSRNEAKALEAVAEAERRAPSEPERWALKRADIWTQLGQPLKATDELVKASTLEKEKGRAESGAYNLTRAAKLRLPPRGGDYSETLRLLDLAIAMSPQAIDGLRLKHEIFRIQEKSDDAAAVLELISRHPDATGEELATVAYNLANADKRQEALQLLERARMLSMDSPALRMAGWSAIGLEDSVLAYHLFIQSSQSVAPEDPNRVDLLLGLSIAAWEVDRPKEAIAHYLVAIQADAKWADAATILQLTWPDHEKNPLEAVRAATLARHPDATTPKSEQ